MDELQEIWLNGGGEKEETPSKKYDKYLTVPEVKGYQRPFFLEFFDARDLIYLSVTVGLLAALIPWWTGVSLVVGLMSTSLFFIFGAVLFISGTVLNLRNPMGILGQISGVVLFHIEVGFQFAGDRDDFGTDLGHPEIGIFFAAVSIILCFIALLDESDDKAGDHQ